MPVNDAPTLKDAKVNCALCCVAGLLGSTAETVRGQVEIAMGQNNVPADETFLEYAFRCCGQTRTDVGRETLRCQVLGVQDYLTRHCNQATTLIADTANPLQLSVLEQQMAQAPNGAWFIVLIMDWDDMFDQAMNAHWITARLQNAAITWTDFQLDVPNGQVAAMQKSTGRRNAPFGAPAVTNGPREAFGDPSQGSNRYMAVQVTPAQAQNNGTVKCCCYITTAACRVMGLPDDCFELQALRRFRDEVLLAEPEGAAQVAAYYTAAPAVVAALDSRADNEAIYRGLFRDYIAPAAQAAARGDPASARALFEAGVRRAAQLVGWPVSDPPSQDPA